MKKSFLIPCVHKHIDSLKNIKNLLENSSVKPDEVIIHISSCPDNFKHKDVQEMFSGKGYCFKLEVTQEFRDAGVNRNNLAQEADGEILIYQDADDFFHPKRIELIEKAFEEENIKHLAHSYLFSNGDLTSVKFEDVQFDFKKIFPLEIFYSIIFKNDLSDCKNFQCYGSFESNKELNFKLGFPIHNGAIAIRKEVCKEIKWKSKKEHRMIAEDQDFNFECYHKYNKSFLLLERNIYYYNLDNRTNGGF